MDEKYVGYGKPGQILTKSPTDRPPNRLKDSGPCRETAQTMLKRKIKDCQFRLEGYESLLKMLGEEVGPAEEVIWRLLCHEGNPNY